MSNYIVASGWSNTLIYYVINIKKVDEDQPIISIPKIGMHSLPKHLKAARSFNSKTLVTNIKTIYLKVSDCNILLI